MRWSATLVLSLFTLTLSPTAQAQGVPRPPSPPAAQARSSPSLAGADDPTIRAARSRGLAAVVSQADCGGGSYSVVNSPDGTSVSVLFDNFTAKGGPAGPATVRTQCAVRIPLNLPPGYSLGVFRMDYRGFAHLDAGQSALMGVRYSAGGTGRSRYFQRGVNGLFDGDFSFVENISAGMLRRAGCGEDASLNLTATLDLRTNGGSTEAEVTLDSIDGSAQGGVVLFIDLRKCGT